MRNRHLATALALVAILVGFGLRVAGWGRDRSLEDEALYAYWGLQIATGRDPLLRAEAVDKPPLHPYILALALKVVAGVPRLSELALARSTPAAAAEAWLVDAARARQIESTVRLPSLVASTASLALIFCLGCRLYGNPLVGLAATWLLALSAFDISFAPTAFTDPLMTAGVLAALWAAVAGRPAGAGLLAGLAAATKQQGLLFLPLVLALTIHRQSPAPPTPGRPNAPPIADAKSRRRSDMRTVLIFGFGFGLVLGGALLWDAARARDMGFFAQSIASYGGLRLAEPSALPERAISWLRLLWYTWVSPWFLGLVAAALAFCALQAARRHRVPAGPLAEAEQRAGGGICRNRQGRQVDCILALFVVAYLLAHWLLTFQLWDRYLLGVVPLLALLSARVLAGALASVPSTWPVSRVLPVALPLALMAILLLPAVAAARGQIPVGGDHGAYDGIDSLATCIRTSLPPGGVLYDHWLGYHYRLYLYGAPLRIHWYPDSADLAHDAKVYRREPRAIAFPTWHDASQEIQALAAAGIGLAPVCQTARRDGSPSFLLYRLEGP